MIPNRADKDKEFTIPVLDKELIVYVVALGVSNEKAYARFHPEFLDINGKLSDIGKKQCRQFFSYARNKEYMDAYRDTLERTFGKSKRPQVTEEMSESRKDKALKIFTNKVYDQMEQVDNLQEMTDVATLGKAVKIFREEEEKVELPRRYLPETCNECAFKKFVEENIKLGNIKEVKDERESDLCAE